jgi:hypothetical protein
VAVCAAVATAAPSPGVTPFPVSSVDTNGPQTANVPTVAWVGEDARLVVCDPVIAPSSFTVLQTANWNVEDWTGDQASAATPTFDGSSANNITVTNNPGSAAFFSASDTPAHTPGEGCVSANISSLHSGLAIVSVDVADTATADAGLVNPKQVFSNQFLVIWLTANAPILAEASVTSLSHPGTPGTDAPPTTFSQLSTKGITNATNWLGDPTGNGIFSPDMWGKDSTDANNTPTSNNGLVDIRVTGSFPIEDQPPATTNTSFFGASSFTLPRDWAKLAGIIATSSLDNTATNPMLWDIHGGPTNANTHVGAVNEPCPADTFGAVFGSMFDAVNNCLGNATVNEAGTVYSRVYGDVTSGDTATIGPYDPQAANETLIPDGHLNSDDAPMPALPITVSITPNAGGMDIGGVGGLYAASKALIYSHNFDGNAETKGNLYNPYYSAYIPATLRPINEASGVNGVYNGGGKGTSGDDFPGFSNGNTDPYVFWTALNAMSADKGGATKCLRRDDGSQQSPSNPTYYYNPDYPTSVLVYTDERGEAYVTYNPGNGFYFNNLIAAGKLSVDNNNGCDLQSLLGMPLGTSTITAQTAYPYKAVPYVPPAAANSLTKTVNSEWSKTLTAYPKLDASGVPASIFVAKATDINGAPFTHELVCFSVQSTAGSAPAVGVFSGQVLSAAGAVLADTTGSTAHSAPSGTMGYTCAYTNGMGEAGVEIVGSVPSVDVIAWFVNEHLLRDLSTTLGGPATGPAEPVTTTTTTTTTTSTSSTPGYGPIQNTGSAGSSGVTVTQAGSIAISSSSGSSGSGSKGSTGGKSATSIGTVKFAHLLRSANGKYSVKLELLSSKKTVTIKIKVFGPKGKLMHTYTKTVKTNKSVTVQLGSIKNLGSLVVSL